MTNDNTGGYNRFAVLIDRVGLGYLRLNIHGYGLVVLGTGLWQVLVANALWRPHE